MMKIRGWCKKELSKKLVCYDQMERMCLKGEKLE
jgi:hypothetical protein